MYSLLNTRYTILFLFLFIAHCFPILSGLIAQVPPPAPSPVIDELKKQLHSTDSIIEIRWDKKMYCNTIYSAELIIAGSNRGEALLNSEAIDDVNYSLAAFDSLGVKGISISINYPVLVSSFPKSSEYLAFYKLAVNAIKDKGFKLLVTCQASSVDTVLNKLDINSFYNNMNSSRYKSEKAQMLQTIIDSLKPDYLTIENEPETIELNTGLISSTDSVAAYINYMLDTLDRNQTKIGAGCGTWENLKYAENISAISSLDYFDMHIFPVYFDYVFENIVKIDSMARANNKKLIIGQSWLYKASSLELLMGRAYTSPDSITSRDVFDTFIPVDSMFIHTIYKLSNMYESDFTSLYWSQYLFGYLHYNKYIHDKIRPWNLLSYANDTAFANIRKIKISDSGIEFYKLISKECIPEGISDIDNNISKFINIYPNPVESYFNIEFYNSQPDFIKLKIYDFRGKLIRILISKNLTPGNYSISFDTGFMENGIYSLILQTSKESISRKIIKIQNQLPTTN